VSAFVAPIPEAPGSFGRCLCGCPIYDHGRIHKDGNEVWVGCKIAGCECTQFKASDGSQWPNVYGGPVPDEPTDLDRNSDHWIDGQVYLTGDEPPL
jgi:hypothetical protein